MNPDKTHFVAAACGRRNAADFLGQCSGQCPIESSTDASIRNLWGRLQVKPAPNLPMIRLKGMSMQIDPNQELLRTPEATLAKKLMTRRDETGSTSLPSAARLTRALNEMPDVRPEKVAQAKALVNMLGYPGEKTLDKVAGLLADHLSPKPDVGQT